MGVAHMSDRKNVCNCIGQEKVSLTGGIFRDRFQLNRKYVASLKNENLLQNFLLEAGLIQYTVSSTMHSQNADPERHWGWESPSCQVRGHFLGHWISAAPSHPMSFGIWGKPGMN